MRIVRTSQGVRYDPTGKIDGRGAYLHDKKSCWEQALKGSLAHALKTDLSQTDREHLNQVMSELDEGED
jgi:Predicted nucleic-acid-binding protein implicated in transcription termination